MSVLTIREIYDAARAAGFTPHQAVTWTSIALAESGGRTSALNDQGEHSVGLWQINVAGGVRKNTWGDLHDPTNNAQAAYAISHHGTDMRPWTTTHDANSGTRADYRHYLARVEDEIGVLGDPRGVHGYHSTLLPPLDYPTSYDRIDPGRPLGSGSGDQDGLTEEFERLAGPQTGVADTDHDGLSDRTERLVGTDPDLADTDHDGISDATEASLGTDPTLIDSDHDGLGDGLEVQHGTDPLGAVGSAAGVSTPTPAWTLDGALNRAAPAVDPAAPKTRSDTGNEEAGASKLEIFLHQARAQRGDTYLYGATPKLSSANPSRFDCSSLTQWAANKAGVKLPRTAEYQYLELKHKGLLIPVDEAIKTPGALLFYFSREPTSSLPAGQAHVAISKGDGHTIEAKGRAYGVGEFSAKHRFNYAGVIPGISDHQGQHEYEQVRAGSHPGHHPSVADPAATADRHPSGFDIDAGTRLGEQGPGDRAQVDTDHDGLTDAFEKLVGSDPDRADTDGDGLDDGYEATVSHTDPLSGDTDGDGLSDPTELAAGSEPGHLVGTGGVVGTGIFAENVRHGSTDTDGDGLSDHTEKLMGTRADLADTDGDGVSDATEAALGTDPTRGPVLGTHLGSDLGAPTSADDGSGVGTALETGGHTSAGAFDHG